MARSGTTARIIACGSTWAFPRPRRDRWPALRSSWSRGRWSAKAATSRPRRPHGPLATRPSPAGPPTPTPDAQMLGETAFSLGVWRGAPADVAELLAGWERFALPVLERPLVTFGSDEKAASLLEVDARGAQLSTVRTRDGRLEVRVWNPYR